MNRKIIFFALFILLVLNAAQDSAQTTKFTNQGTLAVPNGLYDFQFKLFDALSNGTQIGATLTFDGAGTNPPVVSVTNGSYIVTLDFGAAVFTGADRFLEVSYRPAGNGAYTTLTPRQQITSAPYAIRSLSAATADTATNATQLGSLPPSGFIQNSTGQQAGTNFNIGGNGTASVFDATTQYNINGIRVLGIAGSDSLFVGASAGISNSSGFANSFVGGQSGFANTTGYRNSFFGNQAGQANTSGTGNSFFGTGAGFSNTTASGNSFFGVFAGNYNTTGSNNAFFGQFSGYSTNTGSENAFFGANTGYANTSGVTNTFLGSISGMNNTTGYGNTFVGRGAGYVNTIGYNNTLVGSNASVPVNNLINATAIGANAQVSQNNSLVLGSINGTNGAIADTKVGIGSTAPAYRLQVIDSSNAGLRVQTNATGGAVASFGGNGDFQIDAPYFPGGRLLVKENGNIGIGTAAPQDKLDVFGIVRLQSLGSAGGTQLCRNAANQISSCSSSIRYKSNVATFQSGMNLINRLRPVTFIWKTNNEPDLGLVAEEVAKVEPLLVTHNDKGEVEGVKYDRVAVVLLNAVKEQQAQITTQQAQLKQQAERIQNQQRELEDLKKVVCSLRPKAEMCKTAALTVSITKKSSLKRGGK